MINQVQQNKYQWIYFIIISISIIFSSCQKNESQIPQLTIWLGGEPGSANVYSELIQEFAKQQEGKIDVEPVFIGDELKNPALVPSLSSGTGGPDVFQFGTGPGQPKAIIGGGLVSPLNKYYKEYGWDKVIPDTVVNYTSSDGKLWAVGDQVESTVMFYNKSIFNELNLAIPENYQEFIQILDTLKQNGYDTPIGLGGSDQWPISHLQSMAFGRFAGPAGIDEVMFGQGRWDSEEFVSAATWLQDMSTKGYFGPSPNAIGYPETMSHFWDEDTPMTYTGPWVIAEAIQKYGKDYLEQTFGVFQIPALAEDQKIYPTEDIGEGWYISASSPYQEESAKLLDFVLFRDNSRKTLLEKGFWPVGPVASILQNVDLPQLRKEMAEVVDRDRGNGTIHAFLDTVVPPETTEATYNGLQSLLSGDITPLQFCQSIQNAWEKEKEKGLILLPGGVVN